MKTTGGRRRLERHTGPRRNFDWFIAEWFGQSARNPLPSTSLPVDAQGRWEFESRASALENALPPGLDFPQASTPRRSGTSMARLKRHQPDCKRLINSPTPGRLEGGVSIWSSGLSFYAINVVEAQPTPTACPDPQDTDPLALRCR